MNIVLIGRLRNTPAQLVYCSGQLKALMQIRFFIAQSKPNPPTNYLLLNA